MTSKAISSHAVNSALALALAGVALGAPQMAAAQDAAGTTAQQGDQTFAEIVVTANKREESAQRVPIAITAMSGTQLSTLGVANSIDVAKLAPSVSVSGSYAGQMSQFSIRSVTQNDFNDHVEAPVAVYLDEGYIAMQQGQTFALFDVDRVEILKGPQGTLFGRNATGGLVHYISKKPTKTLDGFVSAEYGAYNTVRLEGAVGGPLGAGVAARLSGYYHRNDGWVKNRYPQETFVPAAYQPNLNNTLGLTTSLPGLSNSGADMGDDNTWALRGQAKFDIGDGSLLLTGFGGETNPQKAAAFARAVAHVNAMPALPDAVILTGDCTEHARPDEYAMFRELLGALQVPAFLVPGNHDDRAALLELFPPPPTRLPGFMQYAVEDYPLRLIGLDTHRPGHGGGELDRARLDWLAARLHEAPEQPTLIFMHHPPVKTGLDVMDGIDLRGREALCDLLLDHPQVLRVAAGHLHMSLTAGFAHTTVMTCPGTDATLHPDLHRAAQLVVQRQPPICLLHHWTPETGLNTFTQVIEPAPWHTLFDGQAWHDFERPNGAHHPH